MIPVVACLTVGALCGAWFEVWRRGRERRRAIETEAWRRLVAAHEGRLPVTEE